MLRLVDRELLGSQEGVVAVVDDDVGIAIELLAELSKEDARADLLFVDLAGPTREEGFLLFPDALLEVASIRGVDPFLLEGLEQGDQVA